ncbi:uncharacterized protein LOC114355357 [Ostrinia furnacalis]|uniref:uncharacterized protein LOC114355357 n=1 Tax=Ostrinia furnacalis TaxID=93504 RepID=UPI00103CFE3E|nr:uncharacterized protein LOC114355357 [Ostrinia furnacalis]
MAALLFDTCCGCIELRTGCLIIGYLNLVFSAIAVIMTLILGVMVGVAVNDKDVQQALREQGHFPTEAAAAVSVIAIIFVVLILLFLIFNIVFLVGVHQNKRGHVKAYLIFHVIFLILYTISFLASFASPPINGGDVASKLLSILLSIYFLLVIRSYYYKMGDTSRQPAIYNTA